MKQHQTTPPPSFPSNHPLHSPPNLALKIQKESSSGLNLNPPLLHLPRLRHHDAQNPILQARLNRILLNSSRERKAAMELADATFRDPVLILKSVIIRNLLGGGRMFGDLGVGVFVGRFINVGIFYRWLLRLLGFDALLLSISPILNESLWSLTFLSHVLVTAGNGQGVAVRPLDIHVLLLHAGQLAVQLVCVLRLLDVEFGSEGAYRRLHLLEVAESMAVIFVEETEDGSELLGEAWEERHCCWSCRQIARDGR